MNTKHSLVAGVAALAALLLPLSPARAEAPQVKTSAPGYYRMMLGDFEITALSDGTVALPVDKLLTRTRPGQVVKALARDRLALPLETSVNGYLINTGRQLVLVDTGAAGLFGPTLGRLLGNLRAAGYRPEQVDAVLITHMHPDHVGGLMEAGQLAFPNATVHADRKEAEYWLSAANLEKAPADAKGLFQGAQASLNPYVAAGKFRPFDADTEFVPGIRSRATHGHTAGHNFYLVESQGRKLVLWGDLMHVAAVQFDDPAVTIRFDTDSRAAAAQRRKAYAEAAREGYWVGAAHIAFPGLGHVRTAGQAYTWLPANYEPLR